MPDKDDAIVEAMARAMCEADGGDPDALFGVTTGYTFPSWKHEGFLTLARRQLAAHRAMIKAEKEIGE